MERVDVAILGAGPAGLAAATVAAGAGLSTIVLDDQGAPGGQIWRAAGDVTRDRALARLLGASYGGAMEAIGAAQAAGAVFHPACDLIDANGDGALVWLDRANGGLREGQARALIVATGARERAVPFPGWTLPGVINAGAMQIALKQGGAVPDGPVVLMGQGPLLLLVLQQLLAAGADLRAVLAFDGAVPSVPFGAMARAVFGDPGLVAQGARLLLGRMRAKVPVYRDIANLRAVGGDRIEAVAFDSDRRRQQIPCTWLGVHDGVIPNTQVTQLLGLAHRWDNAARCLVPVCDDLGRMEGAPVWVAGDGAGIGGARLAGVRGARAAHDVVRALAPDRHDAPAARALAQTAARLAPARALVAALWPARDPLALVDDDTVLCRCEGVRVGTVRAAIAAGASGPNRAKVATRCGMGPCQGRICGPILAEWVARDTDTPVGALRVRPPLKPVLLADYLTLEQE
ncbi:NAD(P)/FAD-dependent oxidoreductase [Oceaniglobus ichthyenteri]|uniref:FAD/NAD(P)-dependent oxidoreductase n=1 Tax=Oceaniglobus ichthyenteri TaxID=2136177 RepID=UPI0013DE01F5|nr:NAD(P)/FAD-dependent oxidoreductase [Oceaniglobus ichthyenteri]